MAQQSANTTGGNAVSSGGSASYSVGQLVYTTFTGTNGSVAHGVQQPYEISVVVGVNEADEKGPKSTIYPNPTLDILILRVYDGNFYDLSYQLFDMNGRLLQNSKIYSSHTPLEMHNYHKAVYFLNLNYKNKTVKTYKIIKN
ncbi:MAG: T9SS type A sorting domain-containing protein [Bacteroidia bacterium]|nr:T9SS type A sorting domain-containing protein [Bacteroidia bacterium]